MTTTTNLHRRLDKIEKQEGFRGDLQQMSDAALKRVIRSGYRALRHDHGSLEAAARHLSTSTDPDDVALATLIREDIREGRAQ